MRKDKPSRTALKVAFNIVSLGSKPGMEAILPSGIVDATRKLLVASGAAGERTVKWAQSQTSVAIYEAFDWMLPGQFEAFAYRKARPNSLFHARCSGTQCKSCNFEDVQTLKASNAIHSAEQLKTLNTQFILSNFSDYQLYVNFIKIFFFRPNRHVKVQSPPMYLQNLSLLL
jgi:hypothetical protein